MGGSDELPRDLVSRTLPHLHVRVLNWVTVCGTVPNCSGGRFTENCSGGSHAASETGMNVGPLVDTFTFAYGILSIVVSTNVRCSRPRDNNDKLLLKSSPFSFITHNFLRLHKCATRHPNVLIVV